MKRLTLIIAMLFCSVMFGQEVNLKNELFNGIVYVSDSATTIVKSAGNNVRITTSGKSVLYRSVTTPEVRVIDGEKALVYKLDHGKIVITEKATTVVIDGKKTTLKSK